jgi:WD repeat-containing protein 81
LHDILLYSPCAIADITYEKILFIFYQLLKILHLLHNLNINCGNLKLNNLYINQNYWLKIRLPFNDLFKLYEFNDINSIDTENESKFLIKSNILLKQNLINLYECYKNIKYDELMQITSEWCRNKLDNFNYLLILNSLAGRKLNCPFNHPIFPWIIDFKDNKRVNLRDLTKTKYRINKSDTHLDFTYQESSNNVSNNNGVGYHLVEFLSEITYFVYKSRITDKNTLCTHVRSAWVPNEYPSSMPRLYAWSPEECIPEFYCDPTVFNSIHDDMTDLGLPDWCDNSKEEFIRMHRSLLESSVISENIHNWIDLVFGYKVILYFFILSDLV